MEVLKKNSFDVVCVLTLLCYAFLGYFTNRNEFSILLILVALLFTSYAVFIKNKDVKPSILFQLGILFRFILLGSMPFLSQDFYRFIWDGRLLASGLSPFEFTPNQILASTSIHQVHKLIDGMGRLSAVHFSNYPPINQALFAIAGLFSSNSILGSILIFRIQIILADIGIYFVGKRILRLLSLNENTILFYFLNPLVIIELTGNLHFEGVMICLFLLGMYFLIQKKLVFSALLISLSIATKLLPLLLLPILVKYLGWKKSIPFYASIVLLNSAFFLPFFSCHLINNYLNTISLWFTNFEFNASFYYLIRTLGFYFTGYNIIGSVGKITPILLLLFIGYCAFFRKNATPNQLFSSFLLVLTVYFFQSTTVHPWYVINLIILACFTKFRFPILWSFTVFFSYFAYSNLFFKENLFLIFIEYGLVIGCIFYELRIKNLVA